MNDINRPVVAHNGYTVRRFGQSLGAWLRERGRDDIREIESRNRCIWRPSYEITAPTSITVFDQQIAAD